MNLKRALCRTHFAMIAVCWLVGCDGDVTENTETDDDATDSDDVWFPLDMGNEWRYTGEGTIQSMTYTINATQVQNGVEYTVVHAVYNIGQDESSADLLIRADAQGRIIRWQNGQEHIWFDVTLPDQGTYSYPSDILEEMDDYVVTVNRGQTAETEAGDFTDCLLFYFDQPSMVDEEQYYTLARNVGIVQLGGGWFHAVLTDYNIL